METDDKHSVEVKIWIKDNQARKVFISGFLKALPLIFAIMFAYYLYTIGLLPVFFSRGDLKVILFGSLLVTILALAVSVLYAVGSGFQNVSELEKSSAKTRIVFRKSKIQFFKNFDCIEKNWAEISKIKETVDGFRIYPNDEKSFFINEYAFQTRQNIRNFREIARTQLGNKAKLKND